MNSNILLKKHMTTSKNTLFPFLILLIISNFIYSQTTWQSNGPAGVPYDTKIFINPKSPEIVYALGNNLVYKTENSGNEWYSITPPNLIKSRHQKIIFSKTNTEELYFLSKYVYKSNDGSENWHIVFSHDELDVFYINDLDPDYMLAQKDERLFKTVDGGSNCNKFSILNFIVTG